MLLMHLGCPSNKTNNHLKTKIIGHRGAPAFGGENTLFGFEKALNLGADGIELDLILTSDSQLIVSHDYHLNRLLGERQLAAYYPDKMRISEGDTSWLINDFTTSELNQLVVSYPPPEQDRLAYQSLSDQYRMPTYSQVLAFFKEQLEKRSDLVLYTEIKIDRRYTSRSKDQLIIQLLKQDLARNGLTSATDQIWLQSFDYDLMTAIGKDKDLLKFNKAQLGFYHPVNEYKNERQFLDFFQNKIVNRGLNMFHCSKIEAYYIQEKHGINLCKLAHDQGVKLHLYTFRDPRFATDYSSILQDDKSFLRFNSVEDELIYFMDMHVDAIMSDYISSAFTVRQAE